MLRLVFTLGWLPALFAGAFARRAIGPLPLLTGAGTAGTVASAGLAISLAVLGTAYVTAIRRPPPARVLLAAGLGSIVVVLAMPVLFSADVYAYAYYGELARNGRNPYGHGPPPPNDALAATAVNAWDGHVPPRCVYGPLAVASAALADIAGSPGGVAGQIFAQRLLAAAAYAGVLWGLLRLTADPHVRAAVALNPVLIWSAGEGHNDAAMVALAVGGLVIAPLRAPLLVAAAWVKAPALLLLGRVERAAHAVPGIAAALAGYLPLLWMLVATIPGALVLNAPTAAWQSPLGLAAAFIGRWPAGVLAMALVCVVALGARRMAPPDRTNAVALAGWFALPNAYPWYAWWIVPLAARRLGTRWAGALLTAALASPIRAALDAIFAPPNTFVGRPALHGGMIALEFLPPLFFLALTIRGRAGRIVSLILGLALCAPATGSEAHDLTPAATAAPPTAQPSATPQPNPQPPPPLPAPTPASSAPASGPTPSPSSGEASANPAPGASEQPSGTPGAPVSAGGPTFAPTPTPLLNPFTYIITPTPVPVTAPDGPHIIEVLLNDRRIRAGGPLIVRVLTSPNVVGVEARALGRFIAIPQNGPGLFSLAYTMPGGIPLWWLNRNYDIVIAAATADGRQTSVSFPMLLTR